jgi:hypothetical protein
MSARLKRCSSSDGRVLGLTCRTHAGGWRASHGNVPPHSWNLVAAPQCPAAAASRDPHRAARPPSATASSYTRIIFQATMYVHRYNEENVISTLVINELLVTRLCCTTCEVMLCILCCQCMESHLYVCVSVRPSAILFNFAVSLRVYMILGMGVS